MVGSWATRVSRTAAVDRPYARSAMSASASAVPERSLVASRSRNATLRATSGSDVSILQRQQRQRSRWHEGLQVLSEHVRIAVVPAALCAASVDQHLLGDDDSGAVGDCAGHRRPLLQREKTPRRRLHPAERAVNPRPCLQRVVLTVDCRSRQARSLDTLQCRQERSISCRVFEIQRP